MPTPIGFGEVTARMTLTGDAEEMNCVFGIDLTGTGPFGQSDADAISVSVADFLTTCMAPQYTYDGLTVAQGAAGGDIFWESTDGAGPGTLGANALTQNVASLFKKATASGGRRNRGRMFVPGPAETTVDAAGNWDPAVLASLNTAAETFLDELIALNYRMVILHPARPAPPVKPPPAAIDEAPPTEVTTLILDPRIATQRRRLR